MIHYQCKFFIGLVMGGLLLVAGCTPQAPDAVISSPVASQTNTVTPTYPPTATRTPTQTSTPAPSPTVTATATPALPLAIPEPLPDGLKPITVENLAGIREIARWGLPSIRAFTVSGDGRLGILATTGGITVFDLTSGQILSQFDPVIHSSSNFATTNSLSITKTGERFALITDQEFEVWDLNSGKIFGLPIHLPSSKRIFARVNISPDGKTLALLDCSDPGDYWGSLNVSLYDLESGESIAGQPDLGHTINFDFSPDGEWFLTWEPNRWVPGAVWRTDGWSKAHDLILDNGQIMAGFSSDGRLVALQDDNKVLIYEVEEWKLIRQIKIFVQDAQNKSQLYFSSDGTKLAVQAENEIRVWDIATGERLNVFPKTGKAFVKISLLNDGTLAIQPVPPQVYQDLNLPPAAESIWISARGVQYLKNENTLTLVQSVTDYTDYPKFTYTYKPCILSMERSLDCREWADPTFLNQDGQFYALRPSEQRDFFQVVRVEDGGETSLGVIPGDANDSVPYWISSDGRFLLLVRISANDIEIWDTQLGMRVKRWQGIITNFTPGTDEHTFAVSLMRLCGRRSCGTDLIAYDALKNQVLFTRSGQEYGALAFTPGGNLIYSILSYEQTGTRVQINTVDLNTQEKTTFEFILENESFYYFNSLAISPDGELLAASMPNGAIGVFAMESGEQLYSWQAHSGLVSELSFSPQGDLLLSASLADYQGDGYVHVWGVWP